MRGAFYPLALIVGTNQTMKGQVKAVVKRQKAKIANIPLLVGELMLRDKQKVVQEAQREIKKRLVVQLEAVLHLLPFLKTYYGRISSSLIIGITLALLLP